MYLCPQGDEAAFPNETVRQNFNLVMDLSMYLPPPYRSYLDNTLYQSKNGWFWTEQAYGQPPEALAMDKQTVFLGALTVDEAWVNS